MRRPSREPQRSYSDCAAPTCSEKVPRGMLMCRQHWFSLPRELRGAISYAWANRKTMGLAAWSANVLQAKSYLATNTPAALAARLTGEN